MTVAPPTNTEPAAVTMFSTPWCGYCQRLKALLSSAGVTWREVNIEEDPDSAAFVRQVNRGNETVPTVLFADGSALTNPSLKAVTAKLAELS